MHLEQREFKSSLFLYIMKRTKKIISFYFSWAIYLWATTNERRFYMNQLANLELCKRDFLSFLEYKANYYPFKNGPQSLEKCKVLGKMFKQNEKEIDKMKKGHDLLMKRDNLLEQLRILKTR